MRYLPVSESFNAVGMMYTRVLCRLLERGNRRSNSLTKCATAGSPPLSLPYTTKWK